MVVKDEQAKLGIREINRDLVRLMKRHGMIFPNIDLQKGMTKIYSRYGLDVEK